MGNENKTNLLVVEGSDHPIIMENIYHLLKGKADMTFIFNDFPHSGLEKLFPSFRDVKIIVCKSFKYFLFLRVLIIGRKYDHIYISTAPEQPQFVVFPNAVFFYLICLFYGSKVSLTIKNLRNFLPTSKGLLNFIRYRAITHLHRVTFETSGMQDNFRKEMNLPHVKTSVQYYLYSDLFPANLYQAEAPFIDHRIRIGLPGSLEGFRRDYKSLKRVLERLSPDERDHLELVTLGACKGNENNDVIKLLGNLVNIDYIPGIVDEKQFNLRGMSCHVLFSPLEKNMEYGSYKGSGTYGDAIYLGRKVMVPAHADEKKEFDGMCLYYSTDDEILKMLQDLIKSPCTMTIPQSYRDLFTTSYVFNKLQKDLELC